MTKTGTQLPYSERPFTVEIRDSAGHTVAARRPNTTDPDQAAKYAALGVTAYHGATWLVWNTETWVRRFGNV